MDLSVYYEEYASVFRIATFVMCLTIFAVLFIGIRNIRDKTQSVKEKAACGVMLLIILVAVATYYCFGGIMCQMDVIQKTIFGHQGEFEIVEIKNGIYNKAVFLIDGKEVELNYFEDDNYDFESIKPGKYKGEIVYAQHAKQILHIDFE